MIWVFSLPDPPFPLCNTLIIKHGATWRFSIVMAIYHVRMVMNIISPSGESVGSVGASVRVAMVGWPTARTQAVSMLACVNECAINLLHSETSMTHDKELLDCSSSQMNYMWNFYAS